MKNYEILESPQFPQAGRTWAWHYQENDTSTSPRAILVHSYYMSPQSLIPAVYLVIFQLHIFSVHKVGMATIKGVQI